MPSPVGHALGGIAIAWPAVPGKNRHHAVILAAIAIAPDLDLLFGVHRGATHSVGAAVAAGVSAVVAAYFFSRFTGRGSRFTGRGSRFTVHGSKIAVAAWWGAAAALAWGSHVLLDWLSNDTRPPLGIMALWPFSHDYYKAAIEIFPPVSRRYWESRFWLYNLRAVVVEMLVLGPFAAAVLWRTRRAR